MSGSNLNIIQHAPTPRSYLGFESSDYDGDDDKVFFIVGDNYMTMMMVLGNFVLMLLLMLFQ